MKHRISLDGKQFAWDDRKPLDISIPLHPDGRQPNCFYAPLFSAEPVRAGDFVGSTKEGGPVNFLNVRINPHGNGTHTECVGHISKNGETINQTLKTFHSIAQLVTVYPEMQENGDKIITLTQLNQGILVPYAESLVIRTMPNPVDKQWRQYSGTNPAYLSRKAMEWIVQKGIKHLLIDLPSVDREEDGGKLEAHKAFWNEDGEGRTGCTITELVFVDNNIKDDVYLLQLQIASFEIDVSPSKPVLYALELEQ
jgi:kynurenine formamidase